MLKSTTLTLHSVKFHCRTCLIKLDLNADGAYGESGQVLKMAAEDMNASTEGRTYKNITENVNLQGLIAINIDAVVDVQKEEPPMVAEYPQNICLLCYKLLQDFERFRQQAVENAVILHSIFQHSIIENPSLIKKSNDIPSPGKCAATQCITRTSRRHIKANKQLSDVLQEIEAVTLLDAANHIEVPKYDISTRDPFHGEAKLEELKTEANEKVKSTTDTDSDGDWLPAEHNAAATQSKITQLSIGARKKYAVKSQEHTVHQRCKGAAYRCLKCKKRFVHKLYYEAHMLQVHEGASLPYICEQCGKAYKGVTSLKYHKYVAHKLGSKTFPCSECGHEYRTEASLKRHHLSVHLGQKPMKRLVCEQCGATFLNSRAFHIHNKAKHVLVNGEPDGSAYKCTHCGKIFQSPYTLNYHVLRDHLQQKDYVCSNCGVGFAKKFMLVAHMRSHASDAEKYPCEQCERRFNSKADRQKHLRVVHLKLKPYVCADCGDAFGSSKTLRHHVYIHTGEKPYVCDICGHGFRQLTAMKTHRNTHANKVSTSVS